MLSPFIIEEFGGLNLRDDPFIVGAGGCTACLDVQLSPTRRILPRPGLVDHSAETIAGSGRAFNLLYALPASNRVAGVEKSGDVYVYDNAGALVDSDTGGTITGFPVQVYSAVNADDGTYIADGAAPAFVDSSGTITRPAFTGFTPTGGCMAMTRDSNRLVTNDGPDRVRFSMPDDPRTFDTTHWVDLGADDTEEIRAIVAWDQYVFVFKKTTMWVYYGEAVTGDGGPDFQFREVGNIPALDYAGIPVAVGRNGVHYMTRTGVYVTTGGPPTKISGVLDPLFTTIPERLTGTQPGGRVQSTETRPVLHWHADRLYVAYPTGAATVNDRILVWDQALDAWTMWAIQTTAMCSQPIGSATATDPQLFITDSTFSGGSGLSSVFTRTLTDATTYTDDGVAYTWTYESGLYSPGTQGQVAISQESRVDGIGTVTLQVATSGAAASSSGAYDTGGTVTMGASLSDVGWQQIDREGVLFRHKFSGTGPAQVDRLIHHVVTVKPAGVY